MFCFQYSQLVSPTITVSSLISEQEVNMQKNVKINIFAFLIIYLLDLLRIKKNAFIFNNKNVIQAKNTIKSYLFLGLLTKYRYSVIPAKAGIHKLLIYKMDSRIRGNDILNISILN